MSLFSIPGSTLRPLHVTLHFIIRSPWVPILYKFIKQLTRGREVSWKNTGTNIAPDPCITLIKPWSYKKSLWEGYDFWTGWPSAAHLTSLKFCKSRVLWGGSTSVPEPRVCDANGRESCPRVCSQGQQRVTRHVHHIKLPRPNNKQTKCAFGKGWARAEKDSLIAAPDSC